MTWATTLAAGGLGAVGTAIAGFLAWPKIRAEARKLDAEGRKIDAEATAVDYQRIHSEFQRLEEVVKGQGRQIRAMREQLNELALANLDLELEARRLRARNAELEALKLPVIEIGGKPIAGIAAALRSAMAPARDGPGLRMADFLEEGLKDVPSTRPGGDDET